MGIVRQVSLAWKMVLILLVPLIGLLIFGVQGVQERRRVIAECKALTTLSDVAVKIGNLVHELQKRAGSFLWFLGQQRTEVRPGTTLSTNGHGSSACGVCRARATL